MCYLCIHDVGMKDYLAVWTYNMEQHFTEQHQMYTLFDTRLPPDFKKSINISQFEQVELHIPEGLLWLEFVAGEGSIDSATNLQPQVEGVEGVGKHKHVQSHSRRISKSKN